jgi:hypothetical protein
MIRYKARFLKDADEMMEKQKGCIFFILWGHFLWIGG